jgi:hypothetical protein
MTRVACSLAAWLALVSCGTIWSQEKSPRPSPKLGDGVYQVLRDSSQEKDVLPLKLGEVLAVHRHRYSREADKEPPRFLVVHSAADIPLDLAEPPKAEKQGDRVVRILLKLRPKAAKTLERLTSSWLDRQVAIILGGEVVTMHKVCQVIRDGQVQSTSCAEGAANYLLEQLQAPDKGKNGQ